MQPVDPAARRAPAASRAASVHALPALPRARALIGSPAGSPTDSPTGSSAEPPPLRAGRLHEVAGPAARAFIAAQVGMRRGPALWILPPGARDRPDGFGLTAFFDPARLILVEAETAIDVYWALEEALRSGAAPLAIAEPTTPPGLTQSRRLQLAAEAGGATGLLRLEESALELNDAAETRWRAAGLPSGPAMAPRWLWECRKNKRGPLGRWRLGWDPAAAALRVEAAASEDAAARDVA